MRVLICGSREWVNRESIRREIVKLPVNSVVICGAARGADSIAADLARKQGLQVLEFPAKWDEHGKAAGPIRNKSMLDEGNPDQVIAFTPDLAMSRGTADMVKQAKAAGVPVRIIRQ